MLHEFHLQLATSIPVCYFYHATMSWWWNKVVYILSESQCMINSKWSCLMPHFNEVQLLKLHAQTWPIQATMKPISAAMITIHAQTPCTFMQTFFLHLHLLSTKQFVLFGDNANDEKYVSLSVVLLKMIFFDFTR